MRTPAKYGSVSIQGNMSDLGPALPPGCLNPEDVALKKRESEVVEGAKRVRYHLMSCEHGDAKTWDAFQELLKYAGIHDKVVPQPVSQPAGEMAVHHEE